MTPALAAYLQEQEADASVPWADVTATHGEPHTLEHHWQSTCPHPACRFHTARARMLSRGPTLVQLVRDAHAALGKARAGLIATSLGGLSDDDGRETSLQSWCDDGWTCEHAECIAGRDGIQAIDETRARAEGVVREARRDG